MSERKSVEQIHPEVDPQATELALAYIERRRIEVHATFVARKEGTADLPLGWEGDFDGPSEDVLRYLRVSAKADEAFLDWLHAKVIDGNTAWTEQLASEQREWVENA